MIARAMFSSCVAADRPHLQNHEEKEFGLYPIEGTNLLILTGATLFGSKVLGFWQTSGPGSWQVYEAHCDEDELAKYTILPNLILHPAIQDLDLDQESTNGLRDTVAEIYGRAVLSPTIDIIICSLADRATCLIEYRCVLTALYGYQVLPPVDFTITDSEVDAQSEKRKTTSQA